MGLLRKFVIYGSILLFLLGLPTDGRVRWRRQVQPDFAPFPSPWIPIKDSRPRLVRQDPAAIVQKPPANPFLKQERPIAQPQGVIGSQVGQNQRARQLVQSGDWIPLAPLDPAINAVENELRQPQFNPIVTLNTIPGGRLPVTALAPQLFSRDHSVVIPSTRQVLPELFPASPTPIFINQPITPTPVTTPQANPRPFPAISVQSVPARVNENRRPGSPPRISRPQTSSTISTTKTTVTNLNEPSTVQTTTRSSATTSRLGTSESTLPATRQSTTSADKDKLNTESLSSSVTIRDAVEIINATVTASTTSTAALTSSLNVTSPTTASVTTSPVRETTTESDDGVNRADQPTPTTNGPLVSDKPSGNVGEVLVQDVKVPDPNSEETVRVVDAPLILGPHLADVLLSSTESLNLTSSIEDLLNNQSGNNRNTSDVEFDELLSKFRNEGEEDQESLLNQQSGSQNSSDADINFDELLSKFRDESEEDLEDQTEVTQSTSEAPGPFLNSSSETITEKESVLTSEESKELTDVAIREGVANGHQGHVPPVFLSDNETLTDSREASKVDVPTTVPSVVGDSEETEAFESEIDSPKTMNGHQPPITEIFVDQTSDSTDAETSDGEANSEDYGDYSISPPGLLFNFTEDFNVSLIDFGNGTIVLENQTYVIPFDSVHFDNGTESTIDSDDSERAIDAPMSNLTLNKVDEINKSDSVLFETDSQNKDDGVDNSDSVLFETDSENDTVSEINDTVVVSNDTTLTSTRNPTSELEIVEVVTTSTVSTLVDKSTSSSESSLSTEPPTIVSSTLSSTVGSSTMSISTESSTTSSTTENTPSSASETSPIITESSSTESSTLVSSDVETSRELDKQTTPLATIINSIISALTTQKAESTTVSSPAEKETTPAPTTTATHSTSKAVQPVEAITSTRTSEKIETTTTPTAISTDIPSENTQEPEPRVPLYVRIDVDLTWKELCGRIDEFKATLAQIVSNDPEVGTTISPRQIMVYNIARCVLEIHNSRRRRRVSEPAVALCFVTDYHGVYSHRLTEALSRGLSSSSSGAAPMAEKIVSAIPVRSTLDSQAVGSHQHVPTTGVIAGITVAVILGLLLVSFLVFLLIVRRRQNRATFARRCEPGSEFGIRNSIRNLSWRQSKSQLRASKRSFVNYAYEDPNAPSRPLNVSKIADVSQDVATLEKEFKQIPLPTTTLDDLPPGVDAKNRFSNVIPVPETRVLLKPIAGDETSEYINANFIRGPRDEPQYYIACQAPLESTVPDFWRMIWEKQSKLVIQLTDLFENGSAKCADYLPPSEVLDCHRLYGDFQVTLKRRELKQGYIVSFITLKHMNDNLRRDVVHYWFTGWPHSGVPEDPKQLVSMLSESRTVSRDGSSPTVVHCCPGTGRTGTVIAIELLMRIVDSKKPVDVPRIVYKIRRDRSGCVQTKEQYQFIYQALAWYVTSQLSAEASK